MKPRIDIIFARPLGCYIEIEYNSRLRSIRFAKVRELEERKTLELTSRLESYFDGEQIELSCDYDLSYLSPFTKKVLEETGKIGYGRTITYSELACTVGSSPRAVGNALARNPIPVVIPCHRVIAKNGIGGYSSGVEIKIKLLELEKALISYK